jgi:hypothetical protein
MPEPHFGMLQVSAASLASTSVLTVLVEHLMLRGILSREDVNAIFEAALQSLEALSVATAPDVQLARALVDGQAQMILTGRQPSPPTP